jgi:hypothetical protein
MQTKETNSTTLLKQLYTLIVPKDILEDFEITDISENQESITIHLVETSGFKSDLSIDLVQNGFMNAKEIQGFPLHGKSCFYRLIRRRWKEKGSTKDYYNSYNYTVEGSKTTEEFGAFLKELG